MAVDKPYLVNVFLDMFSGEETSEDNQCWHNYVKAYAELEKDNLLPIATANHKEKIQSIVNAFTLRVDGPCLIAVNELKKCITNDGTVSYFKYLDLLEKAYGFDDRDFFKSYRNRDFSKILGLSQEKYAHQCRIKPKDSVIAAKIAILTDMYEFYGNMPDIDFWLYLHDNDFREIYNGATEVMYRDYDEMCTADMVVCCDKKEDIELVRLIFDKIRQIIFKEISQHPMFDNKLPDDLTFFIEW